MLSPLLLYFTLLTFRSLSAFAGQIPVVDGVLGGVSTEPHIHKPQEFLSPNPAATTPGKLRVVENSGVCETTPGVFQASGYGDLTSNESIWYIFCHCFASLRSLLINPIGSGSSRRARTRTPLLSPYGLMVAYVPSFAILSVIS